jgi:hypothetical protein
MQSASDAIQGGKYENFQGGWTRAKAGAVLDRCIRYE